MQKYDKMVALAKEKSAEMTPTEELIAQIKKCPSGALSYKLKK